MKGFKFVSTSTDKDQQLLEFQAAFASKYKLVEGVGVVSHMSDAGEAYITGALRANGNITLIPDPVGNSGLPQSTSPSSVHPDIVTAVKLADLHYLRWFAKKFNLGFDPPPVTFLEKWVWTESREVAPLSAIIWRKYSIFSNTMGTLNGRPFVTAAMDELFDTNKLANTIVTQDRLVHKPPALAANALKVLPQALQYLEFALQAKAMPSKPLTLLSLLKMFLGASSGQNQGPNKKIDVNGTQIRVTTEGKKIMTFEDDVKVIIQFLVYGIKPPVFWKITPKLENFFSWAHQQVAEDFESWKRKLRVFVIPSSVFVLMERLVSLPRMLSQRGKLIQIGHKWSYGGMQRLARILGIDLKNCRVPGFVEGDVKNFDQSVCAIFVDLYFSTMLKGEDPTTEDYKMKERVIKFLLENILNRVTHLYGKLWGIQTGGVPSGCFNTSHMDSWVMSLYFYLFASYQIMIAPDHLKVRLEEHLMNVMAIIVYGDDHVYWKGVDPELSPWFSGDRFVRFMKDHFDVVIRDLLDGVPFVSDVEAGYIVNRGMTFLRHQAIINPDHKRPKQPDFLPFREAREYWIRAIYGRETRMRDPLDFLLSLIGHGYGTYASNECAYVGLFLMYNATIKLCGIDVESRLGSAFDGLTPQNIAHLRQKGITRDEIVRGFPSFDTLRTKNEWNEFYHIISPEDDEFPMDYSF